MNNPDAPPRILIADDDEIAISMMSEILTFYGADVTTAPDGNAAVTQAMLQPFDAIILDIEMPVLDGINACRQLHEMAYTRDVPILMLTGRTDKEAIDRSFAAGAGDYLNKPVNPALLWRRVLNLIELHELKRKSENLETLLELSKNENSTPIPHVLKPCTCMGSESHHDMLSLLDQWRRENPHA